MINQTESPIIEIAGRGLAPVIQLIGIYVFFHGHYGPGGGFQGGVLLAAGVILQRMSLGGVFSQKMFSSGSSLVLCAIGCIIFAGTGVVAIMAGGYFMDYSVLPLQWMEPAYLRYYGILFVELGITLGVMTGLIAIYDNLAGIDHAGTN